MDKIPGGYCLKARCIQDSDIAKAPPHIREIFDLFFREASHKDTKALKRGQLLTSYKDIREKLSWYVGWRKMAYTKDQCETAMKHLMRTTRITTKRTTRGILVTVLNYAKFQDPKNYENHRITTAMTIGEPQDNHTIYNKNGRIEEGRINNIIFKKNILKKKFSSNSTEFKLAKLLWENILHNSPTAKEPNLQLWAAEVDKMLRIDSRTERQIEFLINWSQKDDFWKSNILSTKKLREKFDQLAIKAKSQYEQKSSNVAFISE